MNFETMEALRQELMDIAAEYADKTDELFSQIKDSIVRTEYSRGGSGLHRGYYCPSLIDDIIIGNASRGKIYKRITSRSRPKHEYCFDREGKLRIVQHYDCDTEYIIHNGNQEIGLISYFQPPGIRGIDVISLCKYDENGKIVSFALGEFSSQRKSIHYCALEQFNYSSGRLQSAIQTRYFQTQTAQWQLTQERYTFRHDAQGNLSEYTAARLSPEGIIIGTPETYTVYSHP